METGINLFVILVAIVCVCSKCSLGTLVEKPKDTIIRVNQSTYFNCSTSDKDSNKTTIVWYHYAVNSDRRNDVYEAGKVLEQYANRFRVEKDFSLGVVNLIVEAAIREDAGEYKCQDESGIGDDSSAQLVVLDGDPVCQSNMRLESVIGQNDCGIEPDKVQLSCTVNYHGTMVPQLEWRKVDGKGAMLSMTCANTASERACNITITGDEINDNSSYFCQTTKPATNQYNCSSKTIHTIYANNDNSTRTYTINDEVICSASSNQRCTYTWYNESEITVSSSQSLRPPGLGRYRCVAQCDIRNNTCILTAMHINVSRRDFNSVALWSLIVVPIIGVAVGVFVYKRCKAPEDKQNATDHQLEPDNHRNKRTEENDLLLQRQQEKLKDKYNLDPVLVHEIKTKAADKGDKSIRGLTILDKELFVVHELSSGVEVYDSIKFNFIRRWTLEELFDPWDIVSCNRNKCLYILDGKKPNDIFRVDPNKKPIEKWKTGIDCYGSLSVTKESNVILSAYIENKLMEYSPKGKLIREIKLPSDEGLVNPMHALKLTDGHFVVCHGCSKNPMHRVCKVDVDGLGNGKVKKSFGEKKGSNIREMNHPKYLSVDGDGFVFAVDYLNKRVLLLDSNLKFKREILSKEKHRIGFPLKIHLDESNGRLFVTDNNREENRNERILVFELKILKTGKTRIS